MPDRFDFDTLEADMDRAVGARFADLVADYLARTRDDGPVSTARAPAELAARFDEPMPRAGRPLDEVLRRLERDVIAGANRLAHPMAMGHQVAPPLAAAIWSDGLVSAMNQSLAVWEMSPTGTVIESRVIRWLCDLAGLGPAAGGTFTSGGTEATFTALLAARAATLPDAWRDGIDAARIPVVLCGEHAHYAVTRAVAELGLGLRRAIAIPSRDWRMDIDALEMTLADLDRRGVPVMAIVATAGSTATGSFDALDRIADLCGPRGIWLHVDGAHGASALFSAIHRRRLIGIERADSLAWDPHKLMLMPLPAGMLLVRDERRLDGAFAQAAPYLFHGAGADRDPDQGRRSFQCSRRADALKVWVALQRYGADAFGAIHDRLCENARTLHALLASHPAFEALHEPESNILCFRFVGARRRTPDELDALNLAMRERYNRSGRGWITTTVLGGRRVLRVTLMNPRTGEAHLRALLDGLESLSDQG